MRTPDKLPKVRCSCRPKATLPPDHASEEEAYYQQYSKHVASYHRAQRQRIAFSKRSGLLLLGCVLVVAVALMAGPAHAGKDRGRKDAGVYVCVWVPAPVSHPYSFACSLAAQRQSTAAATAALNMYA